MLTCRFHPPNPSYDIKTDEKSGNYTAIFAEESYNKKPLKNLSIHVIETSSKTKIPVFCFRSRTAKLTLIYSHGNATDMGLMFSMYAFMSSELKINVVAYDYTGYGTSMADGIRPTEKQTYRDIDAVYDWCITSNLVTNPRSEIVLYGQSVGSGPSCYLASTRPVAGLILHSGRTSVNQWINERTNERVIFSCTIMYYLVLMSCVCMCHVAGILSGIRVLTQSRALWCFDIYPNITRIQHVSCPTFVIHGMV